MRDVRGDVSIRDCIAEEQRSFISNANHGNLHRDRSDNVTGTEGFRLINNLYFRERISTLLETRHFSASTSRNLRSRSTTDIARVAYVMSCYMSHDALICGTHIGEHVRAYACICMRVCM